ncbi:Solitary outer membrane autotransporter beta-barrel domain [Desulfonatronum thioautotrophicum]|uniref:Solitary outer membrane autotransporter beta-barrel domain n=1 Tax=Desulfonatronum thioautotrophicum TaxID=617001 RepID=UPI0012947A6B|nr:Solitary outer membrane autotransporter beta-barrel domain [Desulfonatronum thioautotrophicum]
MQRWFLMVVLLSLFVVQTGKFAQAQQLSGDVLEEFRAEMQDFFKFTSSILITFTSQTGVTQGNFVFSSDIDEDYSLKVFKAPLRYYLVPAENRLRPFVTLSYGHARTSVTYRSADYYPEDLDVRDRDRSRTNSFGVKTGASWEYRPGFTLEPFLGVAYSHIEYLYEFNTRFMREIIELFPELDRDAYNTTVDLYSVSSGLRHSLDYPLGPGLFGFDLQYVYQYSRPWRSKSSFVDFSAHSSFLGTTLDYELPTGLNLLDRELSIKPFVSRTDLFGDFNKGMHLHHFYEFGMNLILDVGPFRNLFSRISLGGSYITGENFQGWKFGLTFI